MFPGADSGGRRVVEADRIVSQHGVVAGLDQINERLAVGVGQRQAAETPGHVHRQRHVRGQHHQHAADAGVGVGHADGRDRQDAQPLGLVGLAGQLIQSRS